MRILQVIKDLDEGGAQVVVQHLVDELVATGHEVAVAAMPGRLTPQVAAPQYGLPMTGANPRLLPAGVAALRTAITDFRPDVVHAHNPGTMPVTSAATRRGRRPPALVTLHGSPPEQYRANARIAKVAGLLTVACGPAVARLMAQAGSPVDATVPNGVRVRVQRTREQVRQELGLGADEFVAIQVGRLADVKNPRLAVDAFAAARTGGTLLLAGAGPLQGELRDDIARRGLGDVRLLGPRADAADLMAAADVVTLTSRSEGLPLAALEAMTLGVPVLGVQAPGITELVHDGEDGLLVPPDVTAVSEALARLAHDPALVARLGAGARRRAVEFTTSAMADHYVRLYESLLR